MTHTELQKLFFNEIPITATMGLNVSLVSGQTIEISFSLAKNRNHKGTAFGGSQYTACALACYGLFLVGIREQGFLTNDVVIGEGRIKYLHPVTSDFNVRADWDADLKNSFFKTLTFKKKSRVLLQAKILAKGIVCAEFSGDFIAKLH